MTLLSLTTRERVKRRGPFQNPTTADTNADAQIDTMILAVSQAIEDWIDVPLYQEARTETYSCAQFQYELRLRSIGPKHPAPTITSVKKRNSWQTAWADETALTADTDYALVGFPGGVLTFASDLPEGRDTVQVIYTSGLTTDTDDVLLGYPELADAADAQIVYEFTRKKEMGQHSLNVQGTTSTQREVKLLASVVERLAPYRRLVI